MLTMSNLSGTLSVFTAGRLLFDIHDVVTVFHAAGADDSEYARITLLHIPLMLLKYFSSNSHGIHAPPPSTPFVHVVKVNPTLSVTVMTGAQGRAQAESWPAVCPSFWTDSRGHLTYLQPPSTLGSQHLTTTWTALDP